MSGTCSGVNPAHARPAETPTTRTPLLALGGAPALPGPDWLSPYQPSCQPEKKKSNPATATYAHFPNQSRAFDKRFLNKTPLKNNHADARVASPAGMTLEPFGPPHDPLSGHVLSAYKHYDGSPGPAELREPPTTPSWLLTSPSPP